MSKRSKIQMGIEKKTRQKERREGIKKNLRDKVHISKRDINELSNFKHILLMCPELSKLKGTLDG